MNQQKNQAPEGADLLRNIQSEVNAESTPLLEFIMRHGGTIAAVVIIGLLALAASGAWRWYSTGRDTDIRNELARITLNQQGAERVKALAALAGKAPSSLMGSVCLAWGQAAIENNDPDAAAEAYSRVAKADGDGTTGLLAAFGEAASLLKAGKADTALSLLQGLEARMQKGDDTVALRQMLAEAALKAGRKELAAKTYQALSNDAQGAEAAYFRARSIALGASAEAAANAAAPESTAPAQTRTGTDPAAPTAK